MIEEERKPVLTVVLYMNVKHDLPEEDFKETYCPFCGHESVEEDEIMHVEDRYEDWN